MTTLTRSALPFSLLAIAAVVGFWPHYLAVLGRGFPPLAHWHAASVALWLALLIAQPLLIRRNRRDLHRLFGSLAWVLAPLILLSSVALAWRMTAPLAGAAIEPFRYGLFFVQVATSALFAACVGAALAWRRDTALHARCMVAGGLTFIDPIFARVVSHFAPPALQRVDWASAAFAVAIALALAVVDRRASRGRWVFPVVAATLALIAAISTVIGEWLPWRSLLERLFLS